MGQGKPAKAGARAGRGQGRPGRQGPETPRKKCKKMQKTCKTQMQKKCKINAKLLVWGRFWDHFAFFFLHFFCVWFAPLCLAARPLCSPPSCPSTPPRPTPIPETAPPNSGPCQSGEDQTPNPPDQKPQAPDSRFGTQAKTTSLNSLGTPDLVKAFLCPQARLRLPGSRQRLLELRLHPHKKKNNLNLIVYSMLLTF